MAATYPLYTNNGSTFLSQAITTTNQTEIVVSSATGFPTQLTASEDLYYFLISVEDVSGSIEIMKVVAMSGSGNRTWTVNRAQEGTTAKVFSTPGTTRVELRATAAALTNFLRRTSDDFLKAGDAWPVEVSPYRAAGTRVIFRNTMSNPGATPTGMEPGEIALDLKGRKLWVCGTTGAGAGSAVIYELTAQIAVQSTTPSYPSTGMLWFNTNTYELSVYSGGTWRGISILSALNNDLTIAHGPSLSQSYGIKLQKADNQSFQAMYFDDTTGTLRVGTDTADIALRGSLIKVTTDGTTRFLRNYNWTTPTNYYDSYVDASGGINYHTIKPALSNSAHRLWTRMADGTNRSALVNPTGHVSNDIAATVDTNSPANYLATKAFVEDRANRVGLGKMIACGRVNTTGLTVVGQGLADVARNGNFLLGGGFNVTLSTSYSTFGNVVAQVTPIYAAVAGSPVQWSATVSISSIPANLVYVWITRQSGTTAPAPADLDFLITVYDMGA